MSRKVFTTHYLIEIGKIAEVKQVLSWVLGCWFVQNTKGISDAEATPDHKKHLSEDRMRPEIMVRYNCPLWGFGFVPGEDPPFSWDLSVMKFYLMTISILLILVHKTAGGLFGFNYDKNQKPWNPCQLYQGACRNTCKKYEIQYLLCQNGKKCCLKVSVNIANSNKERGDCNSTSDLSATNT
ncbi:beta-defensin 116 [Elephas maximus indicus]|uniref:beta-defensin 116 n=1 Tax=Elephas maximus indicus TaxID=99487 RepID=UPI0021163BE1|nr:beta-defensin 116 [Elephas maximus indicus]